MPAGISCWRVRSGLWAQQDEVTAMLQGSEQGTERALGSPECAGCLLIFQVCKATPECASQLLSCGHTSQLPERASSSSPRTPPPSPRPLLTPRNTRREPGVWERWGKQEHPQAVGGTLGGKDAPWEGC